MRRRARPVYVAAAVCLVSCVAAACAAAQATGRGPGVLAAISSGAASPSVSLDPAIDPDIGINNITHVIVVMQENRSFDHYFGTFPGADGFPRDAKGQISVCIPDPQAHRCWQPYHDTNLFDRGGPHGQIGSRISEDGGRMDGFVKALEAIGNGCEQRPNDYPCRQAKSGPGGQPDIMGYHTGAESRTTGPTPGISCCRTTCSPRSRRGRFHRICSWSPGGPPPARTSPTP